MRHGSLESGIGCFDYAAEQIGWENVFSCEINPFGRKILEYYWPKAKHYADVFEFDGTKWRGKVDIITCGFPCQPFSHAGKRKGSKDDRFIWPENLRVFREAQPAFIVAENVPGLLTIENGVVFEQVCIDLENEGYEVTPLIIPACATNKDHRRDRVWIIAYSNERLLGSKSRQTEREFRHETKGDVCGSDDTNVKKQPVGAGLCQSRTNRNRGGFGDVSGDVTNTISKGLQRNEQQQAFGEGKRASRPTAKRFENENWLEAATRLCSVDVQYAGGLDTETFFKKLGIKRKLGDKAAYGRWRTESLMGVGNTIVWEIAYNIFKAIDETNNLCKT